MAAEPGGRPHPPRSRAPRCASTSSTCTACGASSVRGVPGLSTPPRPLRVQHVPAAPPVHSSRMWLLVVLVVVAVAAIASNPALLVAAVATGAVAVALVVYRGRRDQRYFDSLAPEEREAFIAEQRARAEEKWARERAETRRRTIPQCPGCGRSDGLEPTGATTFQQNPPPSLTTIKMIRTRSGAYFQRWRCTDCGTRMQFWRPGNEDGWRVR